MAKTAITIEVEVRDEREAEQVKAALEHILNINGATGALNLYDELRNNIVARTMVGTIAQKFRRTPR